MAERRTGSRASLRLGSTSLIDLALLASLGVSIAASFLVLYGTVSQPLLEAHSFRQTQTAITAYWFIHDGFALAYQTPISGYPWKIPLEFPFFQGLVALIAGLIHLPLDSVGRAVSYAFFVATLIPAALICRSLNLGHRVFLAFGTLYLLSPQYLFWGRTFMIESTATFFSVATIAAAVPLLLGASLTLWRALALVLLGSLAIVQKITTGLPVIMVLVSCLAAACAMCWSRGNRSGVKTLFLGITLLTIPVLLGIGWTYFTDLVKAQSELGKLWTSTELRAWNFGTLNERISSDLFRGVIWTRTLKVNAGSYVGLAVLGFFYMKETRRPQLILATATLALFLLPLFLFTNLHLIHEYYQTSCAIYVLFLLALAFAYLADHALPRVFLLAFALVLVSNLANFKQVYWPIAHASITPENHPTLAIAKLIREQTPPGARILVYGLSMSSELAYYAQRKSATIPDDYPRLDEPLTEPAHFFAQDRIGALVLCPAPSGVNPAEVDVKRFLQVNGPFREASVDQCRVFIATEPSPARASGY
jgi:hypothetical protein